MNQQNNTKDIDKLRAEVEKRLKRRPNLTFQETAELIGTSRVKLFKFLRRFGIIKGEDICPEALIHEYFIVQRKEFRIGGANKYYNFFLVTPSGVVFIKKLIKLLNPSIL